MNVLQLLQSASRSLGINVPSAYNSDLQLLEFFYETNRDLRRSRAFPQQKRTHTITLSTSADSYQLPKDFYAGLIGTQYNRTDNWQLVGPLSDAAFNYIVYGPGSPDLRDHYRIFGPDGNPNSAGGQIKFAETPAAADTISFDYISKTTILPPNWEPLTVYSSGDYVNANGNIYLCDTNGTSGATAPSGTADDEVDGSTQWDYVATAYESALTDSDLPLFDDDVLIEGIKWRYLRSKQQDFSQEYGMYNRMINTARARWLGSFIVRGDGPDTGLILPRVPEGSWSL